MTKLTAFVAGVFAAINSFSAAAQPVGEPLMVLAGDGVRFVVLESEGDGGSMRGELRAGNNAYPFTAKFDEDGEALTGSFNANGKTINLRGKQNIDDGGMVLSLNGKTYRLKVVEGDSPNIAGAAAQLVDAAAEAAPVAKPAAERDRPADKPAAANDASGLPAQLKLQTFTIRDVSMGNVVAATMLIPEGWRAQGNVEWRGQPTPYAQRNLYVKSPDGSEMEFPFAMTFQFVDATGQRQGSPPPQDGGQWIADTISQRQGVSNVRIVSAKRDEKAEQRFVDSITRAGGDMGGSSVTSWVVRATFDQNRTPMEEEVAFMMMIMPPQRMDGFFAVTWTVQMEVAWRGPRDRFEMNRPIFQMIHRSIRSDPRWYARSMEIRTQMLRQQTQNMIDALRQAADRYTQQLSQPQLDEWKQKNAADDEAQRSRINAIAETHDYADKDGTRVNVPIHYKSVFGDGKGNYVLTNDSYQPGGDFAELKPWK
jgi:hypothetical protein